MTTRATYLVFAALAPLVACFGSGPTPTSGADATIVFSVDPSVVNDDSCQDSLYIGGVAFAQGGSSAGSGYAIEVPYYPGECTAPDSTVANVYAFDKDLDDSTPMKLGSAGIPQGASRPRVAVGASNVMWAFGSGMSLWAAQDSGSGVTQAQVAAFSGSGSDSVGLDAAALVGDGSQFVAAGWGTQGSGFDLDNPHFPADQPTFAATQGGGSTLTVVEANVTVTANDAQPQIPYACEVMKDCIVVANGELYIMVHPMNDPSSIGDLVTLDSSDVNNTPTQYASLAASDSASNAGPVGLATDGTSMAWTASVDPNDYPDVGCWVWDAGAPGKPVFSSTHFSCMDAAVDSTYVYFVIVSVDNHHELRGDGIGRVKHDGTGFESIALGMAGDAAGPRRVFVDIDASGLATSIYAVAPQVIGRIDPTLMTGRQDIKR